MDAIPLIRSRYLQAFAAAAEAEGVRSLRLAEHLKIPERVFENPNALHPANQLFAFAAGVARAADRSDLGLVAGRKKIEQHGDFGLKVARSLTLHQALGVFCADALKEYSKAFFWIERRGESTWFCRHKFDGELDERRQVELYLVELMLQTIRLVAGSEWRPRELWLQTEEVRSLRDTATLSQLNVRFGSPILAIPVPRKLMSRTLPREFRDRARNAAATVGMVTTSVPAEDLVGSLRQALAALLIGRNARIEVFADAAGTSVRTLQRRLSSEGLTFSRLVDEVRLQTALPLLEDPEVLLTDIALDLGYSDLAHFTRAFRRWTGVTPSEYRAHQLSN